MGPTNGGIATPALDQETPGILQRVSEEGGGYTFARMAAAARDGDARAAEAAREMAWEQLHCGPWHSVLPIWRDAYSMACLHVAKHHFATGDLSETLKVLDLGLIMGGSLLKVDFECAVDKVMTLLQLRDNSNNVDDQETNLLFSSLDFNQAQVLQFLPTKSLSSKLIARRSGLSLEGFLCDYYLSGLPVIISDTMSHWPARARWNNLEYLKKVAGGRTVPVEVGKNYLCSEWKQELITFSQFLERIQSANTSAVPTYLAQHPLFDQASSLSEELYPHPETMLQNSSQVDLDDIDDTAFPNVRDLEFMDCILDEGEMLYIPPKWWHYVRSLTPSLSVSFWWSNSEEG
ncbi:Lysine-specific demethylase JMJ30 [Bienertia sinuspersici]